MGAESFVSPAATSTREVMSTVTFGSRRLAPAISAVTCASQRSEVSPRATDPAIGVHCRVA